MFNIADALVEKVKQVCSLYAGGAARFLLAAARICLVGAGS
jgi:hypothetical protein